MAAERLKSDILTALYRVVDGFPYVRSATVAGSFVRASALESIADIDTILVVDRLDAGRFAELEEGFRQGLTEVLRNHGYDLRINPTLGPLKLNDARTAVLHLMLYSADAHREHVINSPFTSLDWQRSPLWRKAPLADVYPVFALQPHHFINARRGARDYLRDLLGNQISYRELQFQDGAYTEVPRQQPMTPRDRQEFAYHVLRFLMQNFLKLVGRRNDPIDGEELCQAYFAHFPEGEAATTAFYLELRRHKQAGCREPLPDLECRVVAFVEAFEKQFRAAFESGATRHLVFRHAPTELNAAAGAAALFQGRIDPPLAAGSAGSGGLTAPAFGLEALQEAVRLLAPQQTYTSPLQRCAASLRLLSGERTALPAAALDPRLLEMDYGACDGRSVAEARNHYPTLFAAWQRGEDPCFPGGENEAAVLGRILDFARDRWSPSEATTLTCTHNVVLRCLIGHLLGVGRADWHRLRIPHLAPIHLVASRFGLFVDLREDVERHLFAGFFHPTKE